MTPRYPNTRFTSGDFIADVFIEPSHAKAAFYIIQRVGSPEVIATARFASFPEAEQALKLKLEQLAGRAQGA